MSEILIKVAIVGSRDFPYLRDVKDFVNLLPAGVQIVSGGAQGVDITAERTAIARSLPTPEIFKPQNNTKYTAAWAYRNACFARNLKIVKAADIVVAFQNKMSSGTQNTIKHAEALNKPFFVIEPGQHMKAAMVLEDIRTRCAK